ncbi:MAG: hypothetical protein KIS61_30360, partial [Candidatus Eremiobacteraeota bacterium]|nr:hypothetical protein [Candidatus Eremiobacteraeota bacterium]
MKKWLLLMLALPAWAADGSWHGLVRCENERGCLAIHTQAEYDAFVERIPKERIQMKQPAPPSQDPFLRQPRVNFQEHSLVAVWTENVHIGCKITETRREGNDLKVKVDFEVPPDYRNYAAPYGFGQYHVLEVPSFPGKA